ncbi:MAG: 7-carboxy-7-deazaguanine synthase QueE [Gammaproteobacteria bacterium]|nr:7-carboxy-7-deazaguanine synthase QueE [Gammaproteobacteria bacterium]
MKADNEVQVTEKDSLIRITEIFYSLQGETRTVGWPTVFIRLTGCPLRCDYCDTEYAFSGGERLQIEEILNATDQYNAHYVTVTGGEPLAQKNCLLLLKSLCDKGYDVSLETSGSVDLTGVDPRVVIVMDLKTPASQEESKNRYENLNLIKKTDQIKFVICDRNDYEWSKQQIADHNLTEKAEILFSPVHGEKMARQLADWILQDNLAVRFQLQLHKYLWNDEPGR